MKVVENLQDDFDFNYKTLKSQGGNGSSLAPGEPECVPARKHAGGHVPALPGPPPQVRRVAEAQGICMAIGETSFVSATDSACGGAEPELRL